MAKVTINRETVVCDFCGSEGFLKECLVCGKSYCLTCNGIVTGSWISPHVCRYCADREDVEAICRSHADEITPIVARRDAALRFLRK